MTTTGELHARAKALGLKGAGEIEPIARAAFSASAEALGETGDRSAWRELGSVHRRAWRSAVLAALEALPEPEPALLPPLPVLNASAGPTGGLKPGDVVSVRGVVHELDDPHPYVNVTISGCRGAGIGDGMLWMDTAAITFIERPAPPEPTWAPGDLAEDDDGKRYAHPGGDGVRPWLRTTAPAMWLKRDEIPGPLHKLTVTREDAP